MPLCRLGPPPRSFADDADNCIMVRSTHGSTEYKVVAWDFCARWQAPLGSVVPVLQTARLLMLVKGEQSTVPRTAPNDLCTSRQQLSWLGLRIRRQAPRLRRAASGFGA